MSRRTISQKKRKIIDDSRLFEDGVCAFCGRSDDNPLLYGKFVNTKDICLHEYCLYVASGLRQTRDEKAGFYGFILSDIEKELYRGKKLYCSYCRKRGATIGCCISKCKKSYHLGCGIEHETLNQLFGAFRSYCREHKPVQPVQEIKEDILCNICCETILHDDLSKCLYSPCCKNSWFHKTCLQKYALSAGLYSFKCPMCNNSKKFKKEMQLYGIHIPDKDAAWELEENAYQELLRKPECDAAECVCVKGRNHSSTKDRMWCILPCTYCGHHARHRNCENLKSFDNVWICSECKPFAANIKSPSESDAGPPSSAASSSSSPIPETYNLVKSPSESNAGPSSSAASSSSSPIPQTYDIGNAASSNSVYGNNLDFHGSVAPKISRKKSEFAGVPVIGCGHLSHVKKSEICLHDKKRNLRDIKNLPLKFLFQKPNVSKKNVSVKKVSKKQKVRHACCGQNQCLKKYFGQECGIYRM